MVDLGLYVDPTLDRWLSGVGAIVGWEEVVLTQIIEGRVVHPWVLKSVEVPMADASVDQCRHISDTGFSTGPAVVAMPPRITMNMRSPDCSQVIRLGVM